MTHEHKGKTSRGFLDGNKILAKIGLAKGMNVLDVGSSDGNFSIPATKIVGKEGRVFAVDIHEEALSKLKSNVKNKELKNINIIEKDFSKGILLEDNSIDFVLMVNVAHGFIANNQWQQVLKEANRLLKKDGKVFIIEFKEDSLMGPPASVRIKPELLEKEMHGFVRKKSFEVGKYSYGIIFEKT